MKKRLIPNFDQCDFDALTDQLLMIARDIEDALLQSGAEPSTDYTYRDLMDWAVRLFAKK